MVVVMATIVGCWLVSFLGHLSFLIIPLWMYGAWYSWRRRSLIGFMLLLTLNPLSIPFVRGLIAYRQGAPTILHSGHARMRRWNVDRQSRAFRVGGSSMMTGNEWTWQAPHNLAVRLMCAVLGPPRKSYDGPFPPFDEAVSLTETADTISYNDLIEGSFTVDSSAIELGPDFGPALVEQFTQFYLSALMQDSSYARTRIHGRLVKERCLLLRFIRETSYQESDWIRELDCLVFVDLDVSRPFAYWPLTGASHIGGPSFTYVPGMGRERSTNFFHGRSE